MLLNKMVTLSLSAVDSTPARPTTIHAECDAINSMEGVAVGAYTCKKTVC